MGFVFVCLVCVFCDFIEISVEVLSRITTKNKYYGKTLPNIHKFNFL